MGASSGQGGHDESSCRDKLEVYAGAALNGALVSFCLLDLAAIILWPVYGSALTDLPTGSAWKVIVATCAVTLTCGAFLGIMVEHVRQKG